MISAVCTLFLAGAIMVSQVYSRPVLLAVFDGINDEFVDERMPDLMKDAPIGRFIARPRLLKSVNPTKPFSLLHTLATGVLPSVHGVINNTMFDADGKRMFNTETQFEFNKGLKTIWAEALLKGHKVSTFRWPGANFAAHGVMPNISKEYKEEVVVDWNSHIDQIKKWFQEDKINFGMAYFEDTDSSESVDTYIDKAYQTIKNLYNELRTLDVDMIIMSTHGKKEIEKVKVLQMENYVKPSDCDCEFIASGGVSFIRFNDKTKLDETHTELKKSDLDLDGFPDLGTKFRVLKREEEEIADWNLKDFALLENILFVPTIHEHTFYDKLTYDMKFIDDVEKVRENGYLKCDIDMDGMLLFVGDSFKDNVATNEIIELTEVYQLIKKLLGLTENASDYQPVKGLSVEMKQLIEPATLEIFNSAGEGN